MGWDEEGGRVKEESEKKLIALKGTWRKRKMGAWEKVRLKRQGLGGGS